MRILITGSRDWTDTMSIGIAIYEARLSLLNLQPEDCTVVHGGARGADRMAADFARKNGYNVEPHPADWSLYGKRAGFVRNAEMVKLGANICLAFIKNNSAGATMTADLAAKAGIPVKRYIA